MLFSRAAEPTDMPPVPGTDFTARARRGLIRRRMAVVGGTAAVLACAVTVPALSADTPKPGETTVATATDGCVEDAVRKLRKGEKDGYRAVYGLHEYQGSAASKKHGKSSVMSVSIEGTLWGSKEGLPSHSSAGSTMKVNPVAKDGRYVMLLNVADDRRFKKAGKGWDGKEWDGLLISEPLLPLSQDNQVTLTCADGKTKTVDLETLRAAGASEAPAPSAAESRSTSGTEAPDASATESRSTSETESP
ncbi:hypothetical protein ACFYT4_22035 [Streptomyces sp. NPDC004609]|uniref:hypothetical protein n=1 Tax=Streptomyces sp. NPDC004609 TaxID=3364704 RepID=UPI003685C349